MSKTLEFDVTQFKSFFDALKKVGGKAMKEQIMLFMEEIAKNFLDIVAQEITSREVVDTSALRDSFEIGATENYYKADPEDTSVEVGTNVEYAAWVEDGHWLVRQGEKVRFVPGYWQDNKFHYDPKHKGGMLLKQKFVEGKHYFDNAFKAIDRISPFLLDEMFGQWMAEFAESLT